MGIYVNKYVYNFHQFEKIRSFAKNIFAHEIDLDDADMNQSNLLLEIIDFNKNTKSRNFSKKIKQEGDALKSLNALEYFESRIFPLQPTECKGNLIV